MYSITVSRHNGMANPEAVLWCCKAESIFVQLQDSIAEKSKIIKVDKVAKGEAAWQATLHLLFVTLCFLLLLSPSRSLSVRPFWHAKQSYSVCRLRHMCPVICAHLLWPWFYYGSLLSGPWSILCLACFGQCLEPHLSFISGISILNRHTSTSTAYLSGPAKSRTIHPKSRLQDAGSLHLRAEPVVDVCLRMT